MIDHCFKYLIRASRLCKIQAQGRNKVYEFFYRPHKTKNLADKRYFWVGVIRRAVDKCQTIQIWAWLFRWDFLLPSGDPWALITVTKSLFSVTNLKYFLSCWGQISSFLLYLHEKKFNANARYSARRARSIFLVNGGVMNRRNWCSRYWKDAFTSNNFQLLLLLPWPPGSTKKSLVTVSKFNCKWIVFNFFDHFHIVWR